MHNLFSELPSIGNALLYAQKLLTDVNEGESVDTEHLSEVRNFRIAVEGLRIALNSSAHSSNNKIETCNSPLEFNNLPEEEKCHALLAQSLKYNAKKVQNCCCSHRCRQLIRNSKALEHDPAEWSNGAGFQGYLKILC